jgi:hypothetical protein
MTNCTADIFKPIGAIPSRIRQDCAYGLHWSPPNLNVRFWRKAEIELKGPNGRFRIKRTLMIENERMRNT